MSHDPTTHRGGTVRRAAIACAAALALAATACGTTDESAEPSSSSPSAEPTTVRLLTHDSFALSEDLLADFEHDTGIRVEILRGGDAVGMVNQAVLTADDPQADVLFGIDENLLTTAYEADLFAPYESPELDVVDERFLLDAEHRVTPIDHGDVCLNYDRSWFAERDLTPPEALDELTDPSLAETLVVQDPSTSTPGLAFLLATYATFGEDGWQGFWQGLVDNGVEVTDGWEAAYNGSFSGSAGGGSRPLVVSYASSPPAEVIFAEEPLDEAPTGVVTDSCYRQVEFAGVLRGAENPDGAELLVDFLLSPDVQADIPLQMFVSPVRTDVELPPEFVEFSAAPDDPLSLDPTEVAEIRDGLVEQWTDIVLR
jgi:thiamine transport system substrate-binding protein